MKLADIEMLSAFEENNWPRIIEILDLHFCMNGQLCLIKKFRFFDEPLFRGDINKYAVNIFTPHHCYGWSSIAKFFNHKTPFYTDTGTAKFILPYSKLN